VAASIITALILFALVYLAHYRVQAVQMRLNEVEKNYEDVANSIHALIQRSGTTTTKEYNDSAQASLRLHSSQLKGAGERIRKLEAELAATNATVGGVLREAPPGAVTALLPAKAVKTAPQSVKMPNYTDLKVKALRAEMLGGSDVDGMPIVGAVSELRQQVEGINSNLSRRVDSASRAFPSIARAVYCEERGKLSFWKRLFG